MSYILDALKKSEQERGHGNIPDVQTVHSSSLSYRNEKKAYWPYILITAVVLNLVAIIYFITNKEGPGEIEAATQAVNISTPASAENSAVANTSETIEASEKPATILVSDSKTNTEIKEKVVATATINPDKKIQPTASKESSITESPSVNTNAVILEYYELPESIKQDLPSITVSAHIYSTNPMQRSIVINNSFLEESDYVLDGLILIEITPNGAIFNYQGTMFNYGVVSGWQ